MSTAKTITGNGNGLNNFNQVAESFLFLMLQARRAEMLVGKESHFRASKLCRSDKFYMPLQQSF
jgi:hypothetical protein